MVSLAAPAVFILLILLVVFIVAAIVATKNASSDEGGTDVIKNIFIYLVLFATLMMTIGGSVAAFMAIADIVTPAPHHQSFEDFKRWGGDRTPYPYEEMLETSITEEELRERYDRMVQEQKQIQVTRAKNSLVKSLGWIVIPLPVFLYFQRRLARN